MLRSIAVIGARGFVGAAICKEINGRPDYDLIVIHRSDDIASLISKAEVVIHAANPSKRFFAQNNPQSDFVESVEKTFTVKHLVKDKKFILISSLSARVQHDTVYGRNRRACELIVDDGRSLIVRLGPMYGDGKRVGALYDLLRNNPVYVCEETQYALVDVAYNARKIVDFIDRVGLIEIGARDSIRLGKLKTILGSSSSFSGHDDTQMPIDPPPDAPGVRDAIDYALSLKEQIKVK